MLKLIELNNYGNGFQASILNTEDEVEDIGYATVCSIFQGFTCKVDMGVLC